MGVRTTTGGELLQRRRVRTLTRCLAAGALAGQLAGLAMLAVVTGSLALLGQWPPFPQMVGSLVFGPAALERLHPPALSLGIALHLLGPALAWGLVFGLLVHVARVRWAGGQIALALLVGVASQVVDAELVLPWLFQARFGRDLWAERVPEVWSWVWHLVYGVGLLWSYPWALRRLRRAAAPAQPGRAASSP